MTTSETETLLGDLPNRPTERPLPDGWTWTTLGDVCTKPQYGYTTKAQEKGSGPKFLRITDLSKGAVNWDLVPYCLNPPQNPEKYLLKRDDLLVARAGSVGKAFRVVDPPFAIFASYLIRFRSLWPSAKYLEYFLQSPGYWKQIQDSTMGITIPNVNASKLSQLLLPLAPLEEQERIVAEIEKQFTRLDQAVASLRRLEGSLARYKASVLKAACEGRLVPQDPDDEPADKLLARILAERRAQWEAREWQNLIVKAQKKAAQARRKAQGLPARAKDVAQVEWAAIPEGEYARFLPKDDKWQEKYKEPGGVDTAVLPALPEGWVWANIGYLFDVKVGATPSRKKPEYWNGNIPWVSSGEVAFGRITKTRETITQAGLENSSVQLNPPGTVLLAMIGEGKTRGQAAILGISATNNQNAIAILCAKTPILPEWVFYWLMAKYEETRHGGSGGMQPALNSRLVKALPMAIPPTNEQKRIVAEVERRLSVVAATEQAIAANLARAQRLRQAILHRAFTGQLTQQ